MRKGKYREWLTEANLKRVESWARDGLSDKQIAANMTITTTTFYDWLKKYPAFSDALKKGKEPVDFEVENALLKRAKGYDVEETNTVVTLNANGDKVQKITKTKRHIPPDTAAAIFWLKNRQPEKWRKMNPAFEEKTNIEARKLEAEIHKLEIEARNLELSEGESLDEIIIVDSWSDKEVQDD